MDDLIRRAREALVDVAPGPWRHDGHTGVMASGSVDTYSGPVWATIIRAEQTSEMDGDGRSWETSGDPDADARFIAAARDLVPAMADRLEAQEALLREAAALLAEADANEAVADVGIQLWLRGLAASIRLLPVAEPLCTWPSCNHTAKGQCNPPFGLPVAEPEPQAVRVKPLSDEDRDWIDARADELFRANERRRGGIRNQTITPQDFRDYFVVTATRERILSQIDAVPAAQVRAEALEEAAALPPYDCDGDPAGSFDHHVFVKRDAIRALMEKPTR